jgi:hypothetical protein
MSNVARKIDSEKLLKEINWQTPNLCVGSLSPFENTNFL